MSGGTLRRLEPRDAAAVLSLYRAAASVPDPGLARQADEITPDYVAGFLKRAEAAGIALGLFYGDRLIGEIHALRLGPRQFSHVLSDLAVAVHPDAQGHGVGTELFQAMFAAMEGMQPPATRIELVARSGNVGALRLYERLGFKSEGRFEGRVRLADGTIEDDIPMARLSPEGRGDDGTASR